MLQGLVNKETGPSICFFYKFETFIFEHEINYVIKGWYFIKLMRPVNLLIIGLTMWIFHSFLAKYMVSLNGPLPGMALGLAVLALSTMIIAGAGNMINDYFDIRIDRINKPTRVIVGKYIKRREAMLMHVVLNTLAVGAGVWLWVEYNSWIPAAVHVFTTTTLWLYSVVLKRKLLIGNMAIAVLTALVPLIVMWFEMPLLYEFSGESLPMVKKVVYVFAGFAFLTTLIREIQKDFADEEGDKMYGCKTVPVVLGHTAGKGLVMSLIMAVIGSLYFTVFKTICIIWSACLDDIYSGASVVFQFVRHLESEEPQGMADGK